MMDFITVPATCGVIFYAIYKVFELLVRRRERLMIIEKFAATHIDGGSVTLPELCVDKHRGRFTTLRFGSILLGIGLGIVMGFILASFIYPVGLLNSLPDWNRNELSGLIIGASTIFFGGVGMLCSFVIERKLSK